jgi:predicted N-formylglutamate amidohydrolase
MSACYNRDPRFAQILMELLHREEGVVLGDNEPYKRHRRVGLYDPRPWRAADLHHMALEFAKT